jgi:hypothetical protein
MDSSKKVVATTIVQKDVIADEPMQTASKPGLLAKTQGVVMGGLSKVDETLHISAMRDKVGEGISYLGNTLKDKAQEMKAEHSEKSSIQRMDIDEPSSMSSSHIPSDSRSTLQQVKDKASDIGATVSQKASELGTKASLVGADMSNKASQLSTDVSNKASELAQNVKVKASETKDKVGSTLVEADNKYDITGKADVAKDKLGDTLQSSGAKLHQAAAKIDPNVQSSSSSTWGPSSSSSASSFPSESTKEKLTSKLEDVDNKFDITGKADVAKDKVGEGLLSTGAKLKESAAKIDPNVTSSSIGSLGSSSWGSSSSSSTGTATFASKVGSGKDKLQENLEQVRHRAQESAEITKHRAQEGFQQTKNRAQESLHQGEDQTKKIFK